MPLRNRVNPYGEICFSEYRGALTGNRGVVHNAKRQIIKHFKVKRWIICLLKYEQLQRKVMTPNRWTELFFLDEATALAAGHRPCTFCQRQRSIEFREHWVAANQAVFGISDIKVDAIDKILHQERMSIEKPFLPIDELPDGVFVEYHGKPFLIFNKQLIDWSFAGYGRSIEKPKNTIIKVLTPLSTVRSIMIGFKPKIAVVAKK
jgi:hypothetical protein